MMLAYTPFIDPIDAHHLWFLLLIPMALLVAMTYKAVRVYDMKRYPFQVLIFTVQIVGGIGLLAIASYVVIIHLLPRLAPMPGL